MNVAKMRYIEMDVLLRFKVLIPLLAKPSDDLIF